LVERKEPETVMRFEGSACVEREEGSKRYQTSEPTAMEKPRKRV
jgi:hypothetical protein